MCTNLPGSYMWINKEANIKVRIDGLVSPSYNLIYLLILEQVIYPDSYFAI